MRKRTRLHFSLEGGKDTWIDNRLVGRGEVDNKKGTKAQKQRGKKAKMRLRGLPRFNSPHVNAKIKQREKNTP